MHEPDALKQQIISLAEKRGPTATLCPSEVARSMDGKNWRHLMAEIRKAAGELCAAGDIEILQKGRVVDVATARGPIRIRISQRKGQSAQTDNTRGKTRQQ